MNLAFSHVFPKKAGTLHNKPTHFVHKILLGINKYIGTEHTEFFQQDAEKVLKEQGVEMPPATYNAKIHTIRRDQKKRWKVGMKIHFVMFLRQPEQMNFAPVVPVKSIEKIKIKFDDFGVPFVYIENHRLSIKEIELLAQNDGFDSTEDLFQYFNEDFEGVLIHWTDRIYNPAEIEVKGAQEVTSRKCDCFMGANDPERNCQCETKKQGIERMANQKR